MGRWLSRVLDEAKKSKPARKGSDESDEKPSRGISSPLSLTPTRSFNDFSHAERRAAGNFVTFVTAPNGPLAKIQPACALDAHAGHASASPEREPWGALAARLELDAGLPRGWSEPFARVLCGPPPGDFDSAYWSRVINGAAIFAERWAGRAHRAGWTAEEVFGLDEIAPAARHDRKGVARLLTDGSLVVSLDTNGADILTRQGSKQRFYRSAA